MKTLISIENIAQYRPLAKAIPADRILPYIKEAQIHDLKPVLGEPLYYDFFLKFDNSGDPQYNNYQDLLKGKGYVYQQQTVDYPGLMPMLCYYALARFAESNPVNFTRYGATTKTTEESDPVDQATLRSVVESLRSIAISYQHEVDQYLKTTWQTNYPLYQYNTEESLNKTGVKFFEC